MEAIKPLHSELKISVPNEYFEKKKIVVNLDTLIFHYIAD